MKNEDLKDIIEVNFQAMRAKIQANCDITDMMYKQMEKQNGRLTELEKETTFFRIVHKNPTRTLMVIVLIVLGLIFAISNGWVDIFKI